MDTNPKDTEPPKSCKDIREEYNLTLCRLYKEFQDRINAAAVQEFPIDTPVEWRTVGYKQNTRGIVTGHIEAEAGAVMVKADGGHGDTVYAWLLTKVEPVKRSEVENEQSN